MLPDPPHTTQAARATAVRQFARRSGLEAPVDLRIMSGTSLFRCGQIVVRVAAPARTTMSAEHLVAAAELLTRSGVSVVTPAGVIERTTDGDELTTWYYVPNDPNQPFPAEAVGAELAALHTVPLHEASHALGTAPVSVLAAATRSEGRAAALDAVGPDHPELGIPHGALPEAFVRIHRAFVEAVAASPPVLLHGDVHPGNVLWGVEPRPVLCDLEAITQGPWAWDLTDSALVVARGVAAADELDRISAGYGTLPETCPGWGALCRMRAFNFMTWCVFEATRGTQPVDKATGLLEWFMDDFSGLAPLE